MVSPGVNWAGNIRYSASELLSPRTVEELQEMIASADRVRVLGSRHSFSEVADSPGVLLDLSALRTDVRVDPDGPSAVVSGAHRYGEITPALQEAGFAVPNLGSLPHISVAGACATGTHGSGNGNRNLPSAVSAVEFVAADGELHTLSREANPETFGGAVLALGALGAVTRLTLDLVPSFLIRQDVYLDLGYPQLEQNFDEIVSSAYSVSLFLDFRADRVNAVWRKRWVDAGASDEPAEPAWHGARLAAESQHPVPGHSAESATEQLGRVGPWNQRLPHFRLEFVPSSGQELQTEYLLPREHAVAAFRALRPLSERIAPLLLVAEIRTVAADDLWLSPARGRDVVAFHFTWVDDWPAVSRLLPDIERALDAYEPRPHWGKLFTTPPSRVRELFEGIDDFAALAGQFDPEGKFGNRFLQTYVLGGR